MNDNKPPAPPADPSPEEMATMPLDKLLAIGFNSSRIQRKHRRRLCLEPEQEEQQP